MLQRLHVQLLGDFRLLYGDQPVNGIETARLQALLAYLLLHRDAPQSRQHLAFLFWPDSTEAQARANLRHLLHQLRHALPHADHFLDIESQTVQWRSTAPCVCDVNEFDNHLRQATATTEHEQPLALRSVLAAAVECYRGDLLPACYDDWLLPLREQIRTRFIRALEQLITLFEAEQEYSTAVSYAQCLLQHDPLHESTYRHLMRLYALQGERASALRTYHTCVTVLQRELGVEPHPTTQEAYRRLLNLEELPPAEASTASQTVTTSRLIGRQAQWTQLLATWRKAAQGHSQLVLITGEAGIGKTRLVEELRHWAGQQGITTTYTRSYAAEGALAYAPVIEWLRSAALQAALPRLAPVWLSEVARLLPELLSQHPHLPPPTRLQERWQRQRLFEALARAVLIAPAPLLLTLDDLQWCDQETIEWLHYLLRFDPQARLLVVGTARSEELDADHPVSALLLHLRRAELVTELALGPLNAAETEALATQTTGQVLNQATVQRLVQFTGGNPLFVVETVRGPSGSWLLAPDQHWGEKVDLPPKVQAVIQHRLQQLSPAAREVVSLAAVSGRSFTFTLLAQASGLDEALLTRGLDELWQRRLVREQSGDAYDFSHDRLRDVAYATLSPIQRRYLHGRLAQALEALYRADLDPVSAQLAVHYEQAGQVERAIPFYQRAAEMEARRFSHTNAIGYLDAGLRLVQGQPQTASTMEQAVSLLLRKADAIEVSQGFSVAAMAELCAALETRLPQLTVDPIRFQVNKRLRGFFGASGQMERAHQHANQLLVLADRLADPIYQLTAWQSAGVFNLQLGRFALAKHYMEQGKARCSTDIKAKSPEALIASVFLSNLTLPLWLLGYPDQTLAQVQEALAFSKKFGDPWRYSITLFFATLIYGYLYDGEATAAMAKEMLAMDRQYTMPINQGSGLVPLGWAWVQQGRLQEGIAQMRAGIDAMKAMHHTMFQTHRLAWLIEAQLLAGDWNSAAATLDEAFAMSDQSGQRSADAELHRLRGEWWVQASDTSQKSEATSRLALAERAFWQAIEVARTQEAKAFELRATTSLCRLWQRQGKRAEAQQLLAEIYGWFSEGFATADLRAAHQLLVELA